jgi:Putative 2OG-Fe(II) oxygenase
MSWSVICTEHLTNSLLMHLFHNEIAAVIVPEFISSKTCELAVKGIQEYGFDYYKNIYPKIGKVGITQNEHKGNTNGKHIYFARVTEADARRKQVLKESGDFLTNVISAVRASWTQRVGVAFEEDLNEYYFAGLVRVINQALLHFDWAPKDAQGWAISQISGQLAWNIFLQVSDMGGSTRVYHKLWQDSDEPYHIPGSYAYEQQIVKESEFIEISPKQGDLVLFNSRNFHEVDATASTRERITFSSFIGLAQESGELLFWS